ncbi:elongation factor Tu [Geopyxis carbonaria]|nr:elongation factor Tu [Geopyxis carbonaria]
MSRHKNIRNLDYSNEQMNHGLREVRKILGNDIPGLKDSQIEESLWYYYFDVSKTIDYLLNIHTKSKNQKKAVGQGLGSLEGRRQLAIPIDFFLDSPWENIPTHRKGELIQQTTILRGGLLGGSSGKPESKVSKLAALAKSRKEKTQALALHSEQKPSISLLSRLSQKQSSVTPSYMGSESSVKIGAENRNPDGDQGLDQPKVQLLVQQQNKEFPLDQLLSAVPSSFAQSMFGQQLGFENILNIANSRNLGLVGNITKAKSGAFAGPSPDDVVASAQQRGVSNNPAARTPVLLATEKLQDLNIAPLRPTHKIDVLKAHKESAEKENVNFVVVGHVDAGKSTLMGRLLCDSGVVDEKLLRKYKNEAEQMGKGSFALAWVLDQTQEERLRGVTIDTAVNKFETENSYFTILDAPGHRDFIPNMIAGAAQADFAVLVIDSSVGGFESGFNFKGQTKEHTLLVRSMGVQKIVVAVNKLDAVGWSRERFDEIKQQITQFLVNAGFSPKNMAFIPCSGLEGSNIVRKPEHSIMPWYKGPTLLEQLESSNKYARPVQKPLRLTVSDVLKGGGQISGRIDAGFLQEGDILLNIPSKDEVIVRTLFVDDIAKPWAVAGHNVLIHLGGTDLHLRPGDVLCNPNEPLIPLRSFNAKVLAFDSITPMIVDIHRGQLHTAGKVAVMLAILDRNTGEVLKKKPRHIPAGSLALIQIDLSGDVIPVEAGNKIVLRSNGQTVAAGIIEKHS